MGEGVKILIFEDSVVDNLLIENSLLRSGQDFIIHSVSSKSQFIEAAARFQPQIVIAGYPLQDENGVEAMKAIKQNLPEAACFFVTGQGGEKVSELFNGQVFDYISKNNLIVLVPAINRAVAQQAEKKRLQAAEAKLKAKLVQQATVDEIGSMALAGVGTRALLKKATNLIMEITGGQYCAFYKVTGSKYLELADGAGPEGQELVIDINAVPGANEALSDKGPYFITGPVDMSGTHDGASNIILPVRGKKRTFGLYCGYNIDKTRLNEDDIFLLTSICNILGAAIHRKHSGKMIKYPVKEQIDHTTMPTLPGIITVTLDAKGLVAEINKKGCEILGYPRENIIGKNWFANFVPKEIGAELGQAFGHNLALNKEISYQDEYKIVTASGKEKYFKWNNATVKNRDGIISEVICNGEEEQEEAAGYPAKNAPPPLPVPVFDNEALKEAEIRYQSLFDNNPIPLLVFDRQSLDILNVNDAAIEHYGYSREEFLKMNIGGLRYSDGAASIIDDLNMWSIEGYFKYETKHRKKSGEGIDVEITTMPVIFEGKKTGLTVVNDITNRKMAEDALQKAETRYRYLFTNNPMPMWVCHNKTLSILAVNDAAISHYGYTREEFMNMNAKDLDAWEHGLWKHKKKDGTVIDVEITSHIIDFDGSQARLVLANDITERLRAGEVTRQSEANLKSLIENTQDAILSLDKDLKIVFINTPAKKILEKTGSMEIKKGMKLFEAIPYHELPLDYNAVITALNGKRSILELARERNGQNLFYEVSVNPIVTNSGEVSGVSCFSRDITERKASELNIRKSEEKFRHLIEIMHEGVVYSDIEGRVQFVNNQFCKVMGYSPEELLGKQSVRNLLAPDSGELLNKKTELRKKAIGDQYELKLRKKSGETVWALVNGVPLLDDTGGVAGTMDTYIDITEMKTAEARLKSINLELNTFVYKSSHDLKGPLASIKGLADIAKYEVTDEAGLKYLNLINQSTDRLDQILTDLLETVKIKETTITTEKIDMNALVNEVLTSLGHSPDYEKVSFMLNIKPGLSVYSDKKILTSVMQNIIDNGVKYRKHELDNSFFAISIEENNKGVTIKMEDNGMGIPDDIQDKVFDMFYRGHSESKGTGLGLYIVKNAIEKLGGSIELYSKAGEGTIFTIFLPNLAKN